jgi:MFS family permease
VRNARAGAGGAGGEEAGGVGSVSVLDGRRGGAVVTNDKVIRDYLLISGVFTLAASLIWGVNTLFLLDAGLDILGVFIANSVFTASMALFEIPTGVVADTRGRRLSLLLSFAVVLIGTLGYVGTAVWGGGLVMFSLWSIVLGLGYTFYSGAAEAWLVDALGATGHTGQLDRVFALGSMVSGGAMLLGTVGGGLLGELDLVVPFVTRAMLLALLLGVAYVTVRDLGFSRRELRADTWAEEMRKVAAASVAFGWRQRSVRLMMVAAVFQNVFTAWAFYAWQPYFLSLLGSEEATWVAGVIAALVALSTIAGNAVVERVSQLCVRRTTLMLWAAGIQTAAAVGVGLAGSFWWAVGLYLLAMLTLGISGPVRQAYLHQVIPSQQRATVVSFDALVGSLGSVVGQTSLGYVSQKRSIADGYVAGGIATVLVLPVLGLLRRMREPADLIVDAAGRRGPCAGLGIPDVASVDALPRQALDADAGTV